MKEVLFLMCYHLRNEVWEIEVEPHKHSLNFRFSLKKLIAKSSVASGSQRLSLLESKDPVPTWREWSALTPERSLPAGDAQVFASRESVFCLPPVCEAGLTFVPSSLFFCQVLTHPSPAISFATFTVSNFCCHSLIVRLVPFASSLPSHLWEESLVLRGNTSQCSYSCPCVLY